MDYMLDTIPKKYAAQLFLLRGLINSVLNNPQAKKDFANAQKYDPENA